MDGVLRSILLISLIAAASYVTVVWIVPWAARMFQTQPVVVETFRDPLRHTLTAEELAEFKPPTASPLPAQQPFRDTLKSGGFGPEMVSLTGGPFEMGSPTTEPDRSNDEGPQHTVTVPAFALSRTEVSFADYDRFAEATGRRKPADRWGRGNQPVINVSWNDAQAYADWLSEQTGRKYRLPSEAEWEYAARAGTTTPFWTGTCIKTDQANYDGTNDYNSCGAKTGVDRQQAVEVGSLPANAKGLHGTAGNVWEWTEDCWHDNYAGAPTDGSAWREGNGRDCARRVLRGGSWFNFPRNLRSANRYRSSADAANDDVGIRLARTP